MRTRFKQGRQRGHTCTSVSRTGNPADRVNDLLAADGRLRLAADLPSPSTCPQCRRGQIVEVPCRAAPGSSFRLCNTCGHHAGIGPETPGAKLKWALGYRLKSGPYRGQTLGEVIETEDGWRLVVWLAGAGRSNANWAAQIVVDSLKADAGGRRP